MSRPAGALLLLLFSLLLVAPPAPASVIVVPDDHLTIGAAIAASAPGDSVLVRHSTYLENLVIPHDLSLIGMEGDPIRPTINGANNPAASTIRIQAPSAVRIVRMRVTGGEGDGGGGIQAPEGTELWIDDCDITGNGRVCDFGGAGPGGIAADVLHASRSRINLNDGGTSAGAIVMRSGELVDCEFVHNYSGSIIQPPFDPECHGTVSGVEIGTGLIERCVFQNNAGNSQAASILAHGQVEIRDCEFLSHYINFNGYPGAVVWANGPMTIDRSRFQATQDLSAGVPMVMSHAPLSMTDCEVVDNQNGVGARALIQALPGGTFTRCVFARNQMGAILSSDNTVIESSTLVDNSGPGPLVSAGGGTLTLRRSIIALNNSEQLISCEPSVVPNFECNNWWNNPLTSGGCPPGPADLSVDPLFCDLENGDYTLRSDSPCVPPQSPGECGLLGALPIGCGVVDVQETPPVVGYRLTVVPNPVRGIARFELGAPTPLMKLNIFDSQGRLVHQLLGNGDWQWIPGSSVPAGVYYARPEGAPTGSAAVKFLYLR